MSVRNNEERLEVEEAPSQASLRSVSEDKKQSADPFSFLVPTQIVDLPSKGRFYPKGHSLHGKDSVEIRFMTAKEEDILTSKSLLKKGIAIDRMLESLLIDKSIDLDDMLIGDKNALIVAARVTGYGSDYETKVSCPSCGANVRHTFDLSNLKTHEPPDDVLPIIGENGHFKVTLPISKLEVECRLLKGRDEKWLSKINEEKKTLKQAESAVTEQFKLLIASVNGNADKQIINKFCEVCPAGDSRFLRRFYEKIAPNVDMVQKFACNSCEAEMEMEVPFTVDFFWSK